MGGRRKCFSDTSSVVWIGRIRSVGVHVFTTGYEGLLVMDPSSMISLVEFMKSRSSQPWLSRVDDSLTAKPTSDTSKPPGTNHSARNFNLTNTAVIRYLMVSDVLGSISCSWAMTVMGLYSDPIITSINIFDAAVCLSFGRELVWIGRRGILCTAALILNTAGQEN
ncbi:hypothetical protein Tco_1391060 [Tanacetum coccineum]